jgi:hypothetical protein
VLKDLEFVHVQDSVNKEDGERRINWYFLCREWPGEIINKLNPDRPGDLEWCEIGKWKKEKMIPYVQKALEAVFSRGIRFSEFEWE